MGLIEDFIARYTKEYDFYSEAGRLASQLLETDLQAAGVRCIVSSRAKNIDRLQEKCRRREGKKGPYTSVDGIFEDIADLAGVRVALYFPDEWSQVDGAIARKFNPVRPTIEFPDPTEAHPGKRFSGYSAKHYRVQIKEQFLGEPDYRYSAARIEIQVASVLMHAWSEVEHDLVYKPLEKNISDSELAALDQLNGLVLAGEMALEMLKKAAADRVNARGTNLANHYDLAGLLLRRAEKLTGEPVNEAGLGRVDLLFDFLTELKISTADSLEPHLAALDGNVEIRPLSDQITEALLAEDKSRYDVYSKVRRRRNISAIDAIPVDGDIHRQVGVFLEHWTSLESILRDLAPSTGAAGNPALLATRRLSQLGLLDADMLFDFDTLRRMRNNLVHGIEIPPLVDLAEAVSRIDAIKEALEKKLRDGRQD